MQPEGKLLGDYFPFTLKQVQQGLKEIPLPVGHAAPVVICQKTLVVSILSENVSREIERLLESKSHNFKSLDRNLADGFRLSVSKGTNRRR